MRPAKHKEWMFRNMVPCGLLVAGFVLVLDPWPRYLGRINGQVVSIEAVSYTHLTLPTKA